MILKPIRKDSAYASAASGAYEILRDEATVEKAKALAKHLHFDPPQYSYQRDKIIDQFYDQIRGKITDYLMQPDVSAKMFLNERKAKNWEHLNIFRVCEEVVNEIYPEEDMLPNIAWYTTAPVFRAICTAGTFSYAVFANILTIPS